MDIEKLKALLEKTSPAPWKISVVMADCVIDKNGEIIVGDVSPEIGDWDLSQINAQLVALAPELAKEVIRLHEKNAQLEKINNGLIDNSCYQSSQSIKMMREVSNLPIDGVIVQVLEEIQRATKKFPTWPSDPLHALAVISEEHGELCKATLQAVYEPHKNKAGTTDVYSEAIQTAAMAIRFLNSFDEYRFNGCDQHQQKVVIGTAGYDLSGFNNPDSSVKYTWEANKND